MSYLRRYGYAAPRPNAHRAQYACYRMVVVALGLPIAILFGSGAVLLSVGVFFLLGFIAEFVGRFALQGSLVCSAILLLVACLGVGGSIGAILYAMITAALALDGLRVRAT